MAAARVLVVDDELELMNALCETLVDKGYDALGVHGGRQALLALETHRFDLMLCDLLMPGMDGIAVLRHALAIDPALIGIILTGQGTASTAEEAVAAGAFDYILKPFKARLLLPKLENALVAQRMNRETGRVCERLAPPLAWRPLIGATENS